MKKNMKFTFNNLALGLLIFFYSCGNKAADSTAANSNPENTESETSKAETSSSAICIYDYMDKYDQLLTLDDIKQHYDGDMSTAEFKYNKSEKASSQDTDKAMYSWQSGRTRKMKIMGKDMEIADNNEIGLHWLGSDLFMINGMPTPLECFKKFYRNVSKEEMDAAMAKAEQIMKEREGVSAAEAKQASNLGKSLGEGQTFEDVNGIGEAASWKAQDSELKVLVGDKTFGIIARVGADNEVNKNLAIALAKVVLGKCN